MDHSVPDNADPATSITSAPEPAPVQSPLQSEAQPHPAPTVTLRLAVPSDLPVIARIAGDAFWDHPENVRGAPRREKHPRDYYRSYKNATRFFFYLKGARVVVAVTRKDRADARNGDGEENESKDVQERTESVGVEEEEEEIVGYAFWKRAGPSETAQKWRMRTWKNDVRAYHSVVKLRIGDQLDLSRRRDFWGFGPEEREDYVSEYRLEENEDQWMLVSLAVSSSVRGRGIGSRLVKDGLTLAEKEKVPVTLYGDVTLLDFYSRHGFEIMYTVSDGDTVLGHRMVKKR